MQRTRRTLLLRARGVFAAENVNRQAVPCPSFDARRAEVAHPPSRHWIGRRGMETASADAGAQPQPTRLQLHMPVDVRSLSQAVVAVLACLVAMQWAKVILV